MQIKNIQDIVRPDGTVVFVTGCTGQDGSHMIDYLLRETNNYIIGGARRLSIDNHDNIKHLENEKRFQLVNFDLTDSHSIYKIMEYAKPDYFINFAAQSFVASSWDFARQTWESNSTSVLDCLEAIKRIKPSCRFYNAGSSEEFGSVDYEPQDENHPPRPRSPYGASKCAARTLIKVYRESYGLYAVQGWLFNHEGIRRGHEFVTRKITSGVARIHKAIEEKKEFDPLFLGNINAYRDWSDAEDMVDAVWRMLNQDKYYRLTKNISEGSFSVKYIEDYVVGSGEKHSIREFAEKAFELVDIKGYWTNITDKPESYQFHKMNEPHTVLIKIDPKFYRPAEVEILLANPIKIKEELGWSPQTTFDKLVEKMVFNDLLQIHLKS
jgi:GDPmannose 4,6-dehydratase